MARWERRPLRLKPDHAWTAKPGYQIFVADRGAVRFDIPKGWLVIPDEHGTIKFHDKPPPDDDARLQMTVFYLNPMIDWNNLDLVMTVGEITSKSKLDILARGDVQRVRRPGLDLAWTWFRFRDEESGREVFSRTAIARGKNVQPLFTFDYWADQQPQWAPVWDELIRTLRLAQYIPDPTVGDVRHRRN